MFSIPQNLKNEIEIVLKIEFSKIANNVFSEFVENILYCYDDNKLIKSQLNYEKNMANLLIETIKNAIPKIDKIFESSEYRKKNFYISKRDIPRDRELMFGSLYYSRNCYCDKNKKNCFFFIDRLFGFEKYTTYDNLIRGLIINESVNTNANMTSNNALNSSYSILDCLNVNELKKIPRQTIYRWINDWEIPNVAYNTIKSHGTLYVMADEKWIHKQMKKELKKKISIGLKKYTKEEIDGFKEELRKKHYIMSKCFIIFTGAKIEHGRTKLLGRHIFTTSSKNPWKELMDEISKIYDFKEIKTINLLSDAGGWILSGKDELKLYAHNKIVVNTCEFHVKQKIHRMIRDELYNTLMEWDIYEYEDKDDFIALVDDVIKLRPHRKEKIIEYRDYILKHWKTILNMKYCDIKSSMESHISHYVANQFGSRPKGYSDKNIEQYLKLETLKNNGFNILDLYLKSSKNEEYVYNEKELCFSLFDSHSSNLPVCTSKYPITELLHNIAS